MRETERQREGETDRERERQTDRERQTERDREKGRFIFKKSDVSCMCLFEIYNK